MKKIALTICLIGLLMVFSFINKASAQKPIELSYSIFWPPVHEFTISGSEWAKEIEKRTNGRVKITIFPGGTLTPADKTYQGVIKGIADIGWAPTAYTRGRFPFTETVELPFGNKSGVMATKLINEVFKKFQPKEFDEVKLMYLHAHGPGLFHTKKPVHNLEDLKGMKIRAGGGRNLDMVKILGGAPVGMPMGEAYDALSKGVVEGLLSPFEALVGWKLAEVVKYTTECYVVSYSSVQFIAMNKGKWDALPTDIQKIIEKVNEEWVEKSGKVWDEMDKKGREFSLKLGNKIISLSKGEEERWVKTVRPLFDTFVNDMKAKGFPGEEVLKFCLDFVKKN
jgi:TRAP-type transport system periplasmic protein